MCARNAMGTAGVELAGRAEKKPLSQHPKRWSTTRNGEAARRRKTPPQGEAGCEVEMPPREDEGELDALLYYQKTGANWRCCTKG